MGKSDKNNRADFISVFFLRHFSGIPKNGIFFAKNKGLKFLPFSIVSNCVLYATVFRKLEKGGWRRKQFKEKMIKNDQKR